VKAGLRLGVLLLLGVVTLLAFIPLFFAVSTYTSVAFQRVANADALAATRSLGQILAAQPSGPHLEEPAINAKLLAQSHALETFAAVCVYDAHGKGSLRLGERRDTHLCPKALKPLERAETQQVIFGRVLTSAHFGSLGLVTVQNPTPASSPAPLLRSIALYMGLFALLLLGASYIALTHFLVRPLDELGRAAKRVASGARQFSAPLGGSSELSELNQSLATMTEHLVGREEALRKKVEEVERATESLKEAQERLIRSERLASVGRLAAGLAHEIGNPIAAILGLQELILSDQLNATEQRDFVQRMRKETERIHQILRDLLQFARPTQAADQEVQSGSVSEALSDTLALLAPQTAFKGIQVTQAVAAGLPEVNASHEQLVQVLLNLLLNAADACAGAGVIHVSARQESSRVVLAIEDSGSGVPAEIRDQIFEPFVTSKEVGKGTGLGLAVCRGLVEAAQGTISLDPKYTEGARFLLELPVARELPG